MKIAIIDADLLGRTKHRFPNLVCEKLSAYWKEHGEFESKIIVRRRDWMLIDGYSSYRIAEEYDIEKIPVYFVD